MSRRNIFAGTAALLAMAVTAFATIAVPAIAQPSSQSGVERHASR